MDPFAEGGTDVLWHSRAPWAITGDGEQWSPAAAGGREGSIDGEAAPRRSSPARATGPGVRPAWQVTDRDLDVLRWMTRHGMVTRAQVATRFFPSQDMAKKRIRKLIDLGLVSSRVTRRGAPDALLVTRAGVRICTSPLSVPKFSLAEYDHAVTVVDLLEQLLTTYPDATLVTERELRRDQGIARREGLPTLARIRSEREHPRYYAMQCNA